MVLKHEIKNCKLSEKNKWWYIKSKMEGLTNNNMMDQFNDSVTHSAPKKLIFDKLSNSFELADIEPKKRRRSLSIDETNLNGSSNENSTNTSFSVPSSPWETRCMRADLIEAKSRISNLKTQIERQHKLSEEIETMCNIKIEALQQQCQFSSDKVINVENHLVQVRKRENGYRQKLLKAEQKFTKLKTEYDDAIQKLRSSKKHVEQEAREAQNRFENDLSEYSRHSNKLKMDLDLATIEISNLKNELESYKTRASAYDELKLIHEKTDQSLNTALSRIKQLEFDISSYADWKEITQRSQEKLINFADMEQEVERLRAKNADLHYLIENKIVLEEQVHNYKTRLEIAESGRKEAVALQVKLTHMEAELKQWVLVAQDHCGPNMLVSPYALRARIEQLLQNDIISFSEKSTKILEAKTIEMQLLEYKTQCDIYAKNVEEQNNALKRYRNFKERVQKKLLLVSKERDSYKQIVDCFYKELSDTNVSGTEVFNHEKQIRARADVLEKTLNAYKEICEDLESKLELAGGVDNISPLYDHDSIKRELDTLYKHNEQLRRRKEELELELEQGYLKGDYNVSKYKLVHLAKNPADDAYENSQNFIQKLQAEIERLKRRNQKLEDNNETTHARCNATTSMTMNIKEVNILRTELESANAKMKKIKECYKSANMEFREVCYMLFGYRIDRVGLNTNYKLSSMYAESPQDYLNFRLNEENVVEMLETPYSATLKTLIENQLVGNKSLPAFLSALTLDLFQRATISMS